MFELSLKEQLLKGWKFLSPLTACMYIIILSLFKSHQKSKTAYKMFVQCCYNIIIEQLDEVLCAVVEFSCF